MKSVGKVADAVLIAAGSSGVLFLLFNVMRHGWAWHYLALLTFAAIAFGALRLSVSARLNLALLLLSTAIAVYGAEGLIGHVLFSSSRFSMADWLNFPSDRNSSAAVSRSGSCSTIALVKSADEWTAAP